MQHACIARKTDSGSRPGKRVIVTNFQEYFTRISARLNDHKRAGTPLAALRPILSLGDMIFSSGRLFPAFLKVLISLNVHHPLLQMQMEQDESSRHSLLISVMVVLLNSIRAFLKKHVHSIVLNTFLMYNINIVNRTLSFEAGT